jgi:hypothetical protein
MFFLALFIGLILITGLAWFIRYNEKFLTISISVIMVGTFITWLAGTYYPSSDTEIWNGYVKGKEQEEVSCSHSYDCHCKTDKKGNKSCDTCYEHGHDYDWNVYTSVGDFTVDRVDRQGTDEPPKWSKIVINEPASISHTYTNYVKASPQSLFNTKVDTDIKTPDYPEVYDDYHLDHVLGDPGDRDKWNNLISTGLMTRGAKKQVNLLIVFTKESKAFSEALRSNWLGGKKNDVVVVIGSKTYPNIDWVDVFSWSQSDMVNVSIREDINQSKILNPDFTIPIIFSDIDKYYAREPMKDYKYLEDNNTPGAGFIIFAFLLNILTPIITVLILRPQFTKR